MSQTAFILIVAADPNAGQRLRDALRERYGHSCLVVHDLEDALDSIRAKRPDLVVCDAWIDGEAVASPLAELLDRLAKDATLAVIGGADPLPPTEQVRVVALQAEDDPLKLLGPLSIAATKAVSRREDRLLRESIEERRTDVFEGIVGSSGAIKHIVERIRKVAPRTNLTVLILGETGTGKELIAEAIHKLSPRAHKPLLALNCAGLNENLLESQLFGHVRGAFTGADRDQKGYFVAADGGTLFLDEIGDMPPLMQAKVLRALERREITPLGSTEVKRVDVRLVAATHVNLKKAVEDERFREDLYYRLRQWVIEVPPLRERREDIPLLAHHLLEDANRKHKTRVDGISSEAMQLLTKYSWPGNVRELANAIETLAVEVEDRRIDADDLPLEVRGSREIVPVAFSSMVGLTMADAERLMIERALASTNGNREQAAKMLKIGTRTLYRKLKEYGLQAP
ncbi:MAG: sigma 54-interacting transcriptional regulator [Phycisphaerae bacterium]